MDPSIHPPVRRRRRCLRRCFRQATEGRGGRSQDTIGSYGKGLADGWGLACYGDEPQPNQRHNQTRSSLHLAVAFPVRISISTIQSCAPSWVGLPLRYLPWTYACQPLGLAAAPAPPGGICVRSLYMCGES